MNSFVPFAIHGMMIYRIIFVRSVIMRKENEFGGVYHQMNFGRDDLMIIRDLCLSNYKDDVLDDFDYALLNIADRIEKELGIE
jgi:hypothetical protein